MQFKYDLPGTLNNKLTIFLSSCFCLVYWKCSLDILHKNSNTVTARLSGWPGCLFTINILHTASQNMQLGPGTIALHWRSSKCTQDPIALTWGVSVLLSPNAGTTWLDLLCGMDSVLTHWITESSTGSQLNWAGYGLLWDDPHSVKAALALGSEVWRKQVNWPHGVVLVMVAHDEVMTGKLFLHYWTFVVGWVKSNRHHNVQPWCDLWC